MGRTLQDMLKEYAYVERSDDMSGDGGYDLTKAEAFSDGAKAVIDELREFIQDMPLGSEESAKRFAVLWVQSKVLDKLKELEGRD